MTIAALVEADLRPTGLDWITVLRASDIRALAEDDAAPLPVLHPRRQQYPCPALATRGITCLAPASRRAPLRVFRCDFGLPSPT
jgi:hypothetical protein